MSKVVKECPADPVEFLIGKLQAIQRQRRKVSYTCDYMQAFFVRWRGERMENWRRKKLSPCCMWMYVLGLICLQGASPVHTSPSTTGLRSKIQVTGKSVTPKSTATIKGVIAVD